MNNEKKFEPAFPIPDYIMQNCGTIDFNPMGMSKQFYAACAALTGIMANSNPDFIKMDFKTAVGHAYKCADELLKQENE